MVDELDLLKKDWQKQEATLPKLTKADIYPMLLKKSSSVVKWILIVSILEFAFWIALNFSVNFDGQEASKVKIALGEPLQIATTLVHICALLVFVVCFFLNYKKIENTDSPRTLMKNILNTRKTVKYYIWFNIAFLIVGSLGALSIVIKSTSPISKIGNSSIAIAVYLLIICLFAGVLLLLYKLIYGRLVNKLEKNYIEIKKIEI